MAQIDRLVVIQYTNDGRPDFGANPTNGQPLPSVSQGQQQFCHVRNVPGCLRRSLQELVAPEEFSTQLGRTWQNSIGFQHQIGSTAAVEADYVYSQGRNEKDIISNMNLTFNPATGANYPFSDIAHRAYPDFGAISMLVRMGRSSYHALQTAVTKRFSNRWQGSATYTLSGLWDAFPVAFSGIAPAPIQTTPDLGGEWSLSSGDLRHRAVLNGIWEVGRGLQVSGVFYTGIGQRDTTMTAPTCGTSRAWVVPSRPAGCVPAWTAASCPGTDSCSRRGARPTCASSRRSRCRIASRSKALRKCSTCSTRRTGRLRRSRRARNT